jgi:hypothetical protein
MLAVLGAAALSLVATPRAAAAETGAECAAIPGDEARLACYDSLFRVPASTAQQSAATSAGAGAVAAATAAVAAPAAAVAAPAQAPMPAADFGLTEAQKQAQAPATAAPPPEIDSISAVVEEVTRRRTGEVLVTLDNGNVWVQTDTSMRLIVNPGDSVTVRAAALGSFMMKVAGRPAVRVRRLK